MSSNVGAGGGKVSLEPTTFTPAGRRAVYSQLAGYFFDGFDLTLVVSLATVLNKVFLPASVSPLLSAIAVLSGFVLSEVVRPLGSLFFGHFADRIGRKFVILATVTGYTAGNALISTLPTYAQAGYAGFALYLLLRFIVGFFIGGEYAGGHTLAMEWSPPKWRGLVGGLILAAFILGSVTTAVDVRLFSVAYGSAFAAYAWRYVFLTALIPLPIILYIRLRVEDSPQFSNVKAQGKIERYPIASLFKHGAYKTYFQILTLMTGLFLTSFASFTNLLLVVQLKPSTLSYNEALLVYIIAQIGGAIGAIMYGHMSQIFGRRRLGVRWPLIIIVLAIPLYYAIIVNAKLGNLLLTSLLSFIMVFFAYSNWGSSIPYIAERYKTSHRATAVGFGFSSGLFIGGWYTYYTLWLHNYAFRAFEGTNIWLSTAVLLVIAGILVLTGFALGPETKGTDLSA